MYKDNNTIIADQKKKTDIGAVMYKLMNSFGLKSVLVLVAYWCSKHHCMAQATQDTPGLRFWSGKNLLSGMIFPLPSIMCVSWAYNILSPPKTR